MRREDLVLSTKLSPPRLRQRLLARPALAARLREALDYRLTVVQAGTGYGKTTALAGLAAEPTDLFWYSVAETDVDPQRFLSYLIAAFRLALPGFSNLPLAVLQERGGDGSPDAWPQALDALINALDESLRGPALLVLDDYHFVAGSLEIDSLMQRLVTYLPPDLHVILSTRHPLAWPDLVRWRARGELLEISREALAFRSEDIESLFHTTYGMQLSADEVDALANKTEGWPIALQLVWQGLRDSTARNAADLLAQSPTSLVALFEYLAYDVLDRQPPEVAGFLRQTAALRELTPAACDAVRGDCELALPAAPPPRAPTSHELLGRLHDLDLFVVALGERHYRYHHLFHDFLRQRLEADEREHRERHCRAARFFEAHGDDEEAIYHWLAAREFTAAAAAIGRAGEPALQSGRLDTVAAWIGAIPPEVLAAHPRLQVHLGDVFRLRTAFDPALECYMRAEQIWRAWGDLAGVSRALRGQALVYLDTVRPAQAESLLEEALRLSDSSGDRGSHARLIELLAENKLNMGKPDEAEALRSGARALREEPPDQDVLSVRVQLRTGRLDEAQRILEVWAEAERQAAERGQLHPPRSHRETVLILSLIHALRGQAGRALDLAMEGIALGERLGSPFVTTVAYTRRAHAEQLRRGPASQPDGRRTPDEAIRSYQTSIALGDRLAVRRIRSEAMWGLTRAYGFFGDLDSARRAAAEGIEVSEWAGDHWLVALTELALGASCALAGRHDEALEILARAQLAFRDCGDRLGRAATRLWLCLVYLDLRQSERFDACVADLLALCEANGYDFLFTAPSLLGPPDPRRVVPLLIAARARHRPAYVARLLASIGMPGIQVHPGYQLRVQTLGAFRVWRGDAEIEPREWQRDKARQLFQLLLSRRGRWLQREEIIEHLWPHLKPDAAIRDFKVALTAMNKAIEPARIADTPFAFVIREGISYRLRPEADVWLDVASFEQSCEAGLRQLDREPPGPATDQLLAALRLYAGDYLPDALYEDWAGAERERLLSLYLRAADRLAEALVERGRYDDALDVCQRILARDSCWERAYRWKMLAYARQGNRPQALRAYQRCESTLDQELGVEPSHATAALYDRIVQADERNLSSI